MATVIPYKIEVPEEKIQKLKSRLSDPEFPGEIDGSGWAEGTGPPLADIKRLVAYWRDDFDWRKVEKKLNALPTFMATIPVAGFEPVEMYFIHVKSASSSGDAIPLLFLHGWPGSVLEVTKLIPLLAEVEKNGGPAFDIIAPSYPNFGFSSAVSKPGFRLEHYADVCNELMTTLGYDRYAVQAGDLGVAISKVIGMRHKTLQAVHWNIVPPSPPSLTSPLAFTTNAVMYMLNLFSREDAEGLRRMMKFVKDGFAYHQIQQTKPQTIAYALTDSPVGCLAWIYEKLREWSDDYPWTDEEVCTWVSMHWLSRNGPGACLHMYYEYTKGDYPAERSAYFSDIRLGLAYFPKAMILPPMTWAEHLGNVVYKKRHDRGGHFSAWEAPEKVVDDLRIMFSKGGPGVWTV